MTFLRSLLFNLLLRLTTILAFLLIPCLVTLAVRRRLAALGVAEP